MSCKECGGPLGRRNKIGVCRPCMYKHGFALIRDRDPEAFERARIEGMKRRYREDPEFKAKSREHLLRVAQLPHAIAARRESCRKVGLSGLGIKAQPAGGEARRAQARALSERKLAWCPKELREEYIFLLRSKKMKKEEARAVILAQHEANLQKLRRKMGVSGPVELTPVPDRFVPVDSAEPTELLLRHVEARRVEWERVEAQRVNREPCPRCGVRADIGCEHTRIAA